MRYQLPDLEIIENLELAIEGSNLNGLIRVKLGLFWTRSLNQKSEDAELVLSFDLVNNLKPTKLSI